jgi:hypothetical protein
MKIYFLLCCNVVLNFRKKIESGLNSFGAQMKKLWKKQEAEKEKKETRPTRPRPDPAQQLRALAVAQQGGPSRRPAAARVSSFLFSFY